VENGVLHIKSQRMLQIQYLTTEVMGCYNKN